MKRNLEKNQTGLPHLDVFVRCAQGIGGGKLIRRESRQDKEFHSQNWFKARLAFRQESTRVLCLSVERRDRGRGGDASDPHNGRQPSR
jgi:hypothetical protein